MATAEVEIWLAHFAESLGTAAPTAGEVDLVLRLAAVAAHGSARQAAPVACWLAARAGLELTDAVALAESIAPPDPNAP